MRSLGSAAIGPMAGSKALTSSMISIILEEGHLDGRALSQFSSHVNFSKVSVDELFFTRNISGDICRQFNRGCFNQCFCRK